MCWTRSRDRVQRWRPANAVGYASIGVEADETFVKLATHSIAALEAIKLVDPADPKLGNAGPVKRRGFRPKLPARIAPEVAGLNLG